MSVRAGEYARLQAAGWTVIVDSPWRRLAAKLTGWLRGRPVDSDTSTATDYPVGGWGR